MKPFTVVLALIFVTLLQVQSNAQDVLYAVTYGLVIRHSTPGDGGENLSQLGTYYSYQGSNSLLLSSNDPLYDVLTLGFTPDGNALHVNLGATGSGELAYQGGQIWTSGDAVTAMIGTYVKTARDSTVPFSRKISADAGIASGLTSPSMVQATIQVDNNIYALNADGHISYNEDNGVQSLQANTPAIVYNNNTYYLVDSTELSLGLQAYTLGSGSVLYGASGEVDINSAVPEPAPITIFLSLGVVSYGLIAARKRSTRRLY